MRVSRLLLVTLRDDPAEAEIPSHRLLLRAGYIRRVSSGIYAYLPLLWRVLQKVSRIVREEMDATGALETLLPQLQPAELWQRSGRWAGYTAGEGIMFHLLDRQGRELGLGPTHEEVITSLAADLLQSYRQLPVNLYQIQTKFRDEIRPRFGLMRGREFIMKDAYSFHADEASLRETYAAMDQAYRRIFARCGLRAVAVEADSGAIGGSASQEFMVTAEAGEDLILTSGDGRYAANQERAVSLPPAAELLPETPLAELATPGLASIEQLCSAHGFDPTQTVKVLLLLARFAEGRPQPLLICLRGDQHLNEVKLANAVSAGAEPGAGALLEIAPISTDHLQAEGLAPLPFGSLGPQLSDGVRAGSDWTITTVDLRSAQPGDACVHDPQLHLQAARGIEVGHIFQLGRKYSQALEASFTNENGQNEALWMGCYGIGVSRLAQAAVEQHHDGQGICWPVSIAPYEVVVVPANIDDPTQAQLAEQLTSELEQAGIEVLLDDRSERAGVKFKDADLIGIPWRVVVGRGAASGQIELVERQSNQRQDLASADLLPLLLPRVVQERRGLLEQPT